MSVLGIETSSAHASVALVKKGKVLAEKRFSETLGHSDQIMLAIDELFKKTTSSLKDVKQIAVGLGPGSYTGLRVGLATAKGLALMNKIPVVGIPSLDSIVEENFVKWPGAVKRLHVAIDAKRGEFYYAEYVRSKTTFKRKHKIKLLSDELLEKHRNNSETIWGPEINQLYPTAKGVALLAENKDFKDKVTKKLEPIYLRPFTPKKSSEHKLACFTAVGQKSV